MTLDVSRTKKRPPSDPSSNAENGKDVVMKWGKNNQKEIADFMNSKSQQ